MRLEHLVEKDLPADTILKEIGVPKGEREIILEFLPLIPVALWAGGAAWTAYDTYKAKKELDAGKITQAEFAARVGTDVAIGVAGGVLGKIAGKGFKVGKEIYKSKKAAKAAQQKTADIPTPKDAAVPPTGINVVANATTTTAKTSTKKAVQTAKPGDTIKTAKGEFLAGVDGKATTTRIGAPNAAEIKKQILSVVNQAPSSSATIVTTKSVSKALDKLAGKVDPALQKAADAAKSVATKTVDKTKDVAKSVATKTVDKVKKIGSKTTSYTGGSLAPAASVTSKAAAKQTTKKLTKSQRDALTNMPGSVTPVINKAVDKVVDKVVKKKLTKAQRDALTKMPEPKVKVKPKVKTKVKTDTNVKTGAAVTTTGSKVATRTAKKLDDIKAKQQKINNKNKANKNKADKNKADRKKRFAKFLGKGGAHNSYWDTNLVGAIKKYQDFKG
jgi:hypothetical protein